MKKIVNVGYEFISIDFDTKAIEKVQDFRAIEVLRILTVDEDTTFDLVNCVVDVAKGDTVMVVKYYDKEYKSHYKVIPLEGVIKHDMLEVADTARREEKDAAIPKDGDEEQDIER